MIKEQLEEVRKNIEAACKRAGRDPKEVTLIAVSKTKPVPMLEEVFSPFIFSSSLMFDSIILNITYARGL